MGVNRMVQPKSLGARLLSIYLPLVIITLVVLFAFLEFQYYQNKREELSTALSDLAAAQGPAISTAVWEYDEIEIVRFPDFCRGEI